MAYDVELENARNKPPSPPPYLRNLPIIILPHIRQLYIEIRLGLALQPLLPRHLHHILHPSRHDLALEGLAVVLAGNVVGEDVATRGDGCGLDASKAPRVEHAFGQGLLFASASTRT